MPIFVGVSGGFCGIDRINCTEKVRNNIKIVIN